MIGQDIGRWPQRSFGTLARNGVSSTVTTSATGTSARGPEVIAREITRQLLPAYRQRLAEVTAHQDRERRQREARETLAASIEALFGDAFTREGGHLGSCTETETVFAARCGARGSAETRGGADTARIEIRQVPQGTALRILTALAEEP